MQRANSIPVFLRSKYFLLGCAGICFLSAFFISEKDHASLGPVIEKFSTVLYKKEKRADLELQKLSEKCRLDSYPALFDGNTGYYGNLFSSEGLLFLIFENDTLRYWTDNTVAVDNHLSHNNFKEKIVKLANGWFEVKKAVSGGKKLFALVLLKREYPYQNKYLSNDFQKEFALKADVKINVEPGKGQGPGALTARTTVQPDLGKGKESGGPEPENDASKGEVYGQHGDYLFTLIFPPSEFGSSSGFYLALLLNALGLFLSVWFLKAAADAVAPASPAGRQKAGKEWATGLLAAALVLLRFLSVETHFPSLFYQLKLFRPELYGDARSFWLGSLGDLLINAILLFYLAFLGYTRVSFPAAVPRIFTGRFVKRTGFFIVLSAGLFASRLVNYVFTSLISNSNVPFALNDIFEQNVYTCLALIIMGLFFISYFLLLDRTASFYYLNDLEPGERTPLLLAALALFILAFHLLGTVDLILVLWPAVMLLFILWIRRKGEAYPFSAAIVLLIIISFFSAHVVLKFSEEREHNERRVLAQKLSAEQDPLAEHLFGEAAPDVSRDSTLLRILRHPYVKGMSEIMLSPGKAEEFKRTLVAKYFGGYWEKYQIRVSVFDTTCLPLVSEGAADRDNLAYFENVIASEGQPTGTKNLFSLRNPSGRLSYLARIPMIQAIARPSSPSDSVSKAGNLFIEFDSRSVPEEMGFPELMLDSKLGLTTELLDYAYAKYKNGKLVTYHGKYPYSLSASAFLPVDPEEKEYPRSSFSESDGFSHFSYLADAGTLVVISRNATAPVAIVTTFSYLFAFFSLVLLVLLLFRIFVFDKTLHLDSFRTRIQYVLVSMVLFSLLFFGGGTIYYIGQQYERQAQQSVRDKMVSALAKAVQDLGQESELKPTQSDFFSYVLKRMSNIFLTDITLYDKEGTLLGSSQMKLFDEGLLARKMSPSSYYRLAIRQNIEFIHDEKIGNLDYLSAYCAFRNNKGDLLGYLNLPYLARQSELEKEIASILGALINIYVLLFVIAVILALAISDYFTKPLKLIQEKLGKIKLGRTNEPIEWKSQDEIGSLVNEYNRMIEELQKSAELLAKSERETAWREMARQVAHEIKNPLTPMKLSIQHLQRTWNNKSEDMDKKIRRITETLIGQIDALSTIAGEFSNFAKMPVTVSEKIDVKNILENALALFKDSTDTEFVFTCTLEQAFVYADKEQMLRVFNNLLKNALQAIPENRQGKIEVSLTRKEGSLLVKIKDNGTGIAPGEVDKIFIPNFTTKTGGMGLGLAMVKSIVETFKGKVWFETRKDEGTTFYVSLPEIY